MSAARQRRRLGKAWKRALLSDRKVRGDARVLVTALGTLLEVAADPHQCNGPDCECDEEILPPVYAADDWRFAGSPSFVIDSDGDLMRHNGQRCYGLPIPFRVGTAADLVDWPDTSCTFDEVQS